MPETSADTTPVLSLSNSDLAERERFDWYIDIVRDGIAPFALTSPYAKDFSAQVLTADLGVAQLARFSFPPLGAVRTHRHIRRGDPETYQLALIHRGPMRVSQQREETSIPAGGLVLFDTSSPLDAHFPDLGDRAVVTILRVPKSLFPLCADSADRLRSRHLSSEGAAGSLLHHLLGSVLDQVDGRSLSESHRIGTIAVDLAATFLAGHLDAATTLPGETRRRALLARIRAFIEANLGDPRLTPAAIASQHHISVRTLHELFRSEPEPVMSTVRRRRLERCRADLADPGLRVYPIAVLAGRWGFASPAEFSRVFRRTYGVAPKQFRHEALGTGDPR
ncbi:helix-turn-helix domain-containing protein [Kitasatospora aburaviensis]|uniref:Helix-turn-helix domain-containing protein n=1 Tax=Kitasatospora aburaviensis TaxID=67265 RepID=A0ABW1F888_9ACTN